MKIVQKFREQMTGFLQVCQGEFDNYTAVLAAWSQVEHNDDGTHPANVGNLLSVIAGENIGQGQPVYISAGQNSTGPGQAYLANATAAASSTHAVVVGVSTQSYQAGATAIIRCRNIQTGYVGLVAGTPYYVGTTAGSLTATKPTNAVLVGIAVNTTDLFLAITWPTTIDSGLTLSWTGTTSGTQNMGSGTTIYFQAGTYTITVAGRIPLTFSGIAAGGGGGAADFISSGGSQNGGGGGGGGCSTTGTSVTLQSAGTYTLTVPAATAAGADGSNLTLVGSIEGSMVLLRAGLKGKSATAGSAGGAGGASGTSTGSNLNSGGAGGAGAIQGVSNSVAGSAQTSGAGGGGGGASASGSTASAGGAGKDESGAAAVGIDGGHGGGMDINGTKCGGGGKGAGNDNTNDRAGGASEPGGCYFTA